MWIETQQKRYVPRLEDPVIGTVAKRTPEGYILDIGAAHVAILDGLAFDGCTKRNKPNLAIGNCLPFCMHWRGALLNLCDRVGRAGAVAHSVVWGGALNLPNPCPRWYTHNHQVRLDPRLCRSAAQPVGDEPHTRGGRHGQCSAECPTVPPPMDRDSDSSYSVASDHSFPGVRTIVGRMRAFLCPV